MKTPQSMEERLMDKFCIMFERADRENDTVDWVSTLEDFIHAEKELSKQEGMKETVKSIKRVIQTARNPYMFLTTEERFFDDIKSVLEPQHHD